MANKIPHPIWQIMEHQDRRFEWLARRTGYSVGHLYNVKAGTWPASAELRRKAALALDLPESVLFLPEESNEPAATGTEG